VSALDLVLNEIAYTFGIVEKATTMVRNIGINILNFLIINRPIQITISNNR
jgi:hypothetical protein